MASSSSPSWLVHLKTYVDPDLPASHQNASRDAITDLINQNAFYLSQLVTEMGDILTSTDAVVRARGILLLGELWIHVLEKPLEDKLIHHFATFFSARLEDWHSLHGALLGSLALLKRKRHVGTISNEDAKILLESALENLQVQALAQQDRMLSLELFECLLLHHQGAVAFHGALFAERLCDIIDGEKDPRCLLVGFHIVELATQIFPDPMGQIGRISEELFGIISCYFPISFNPVPDDKRGITREDLSVALMHCFGATKLFAEFCIPFLLEKLSSTLKSAKLDSLKFLGFCGSRYGVDELQKYTAAIWMALRQELLSSQKPGEITSREKDVEVFEEALKCFQACLRSLQASNQDDIELLEKNTLLQLVLQDSVLDDFFNCLPCYLVHTEENIVDITSRGFAESPPATAVVLERALATIKETGSILTVTVKASPVSCCAVFQTLFDRMFEILKPGICIKESDVLNFLEGVPLESSLWFPNSLMVTLLEVLSAMLEGAREVAEGFYKCSLKTKTPITDIKWMAPLQLYSEKILMSFASLIVSGLQKLMVTKLTIIETIWEIGVAGLQAVGSFPPQVSAISNSQYDFVVTFLKSIILRKSEVIPLWNRSVKAIATICSVEEKFSDQRPSFGLIDTLVSLLLKELLDDHRALSVQCSLRALSILCNGRPQTLTTAVRKLTRVVCEDLKKVIPLVDGDDDTIARAVPLLQGVLDFILPCCENTQIETEAMLELALDLWNVVENLPECAFGENLAANMQMLQWCSGIVRLSVSKCDELSQRHLLLKMLNPFVGASSHFCLQLGVRDVWILGFFASTVIALWPSVQIPEEDDALRRLLAAAVSPSCSAVNFVASEAVGCMLNKWHASNNKTLVRNGIDFTITEATDLVIKGEWISRVLHQSGSSYLPVQDGALLLKIKCIKLLAYSGNGLAMRGHIAVSDIAMLLLNLVHCKKSLTDTDPKSLLEILWPIDEEKLAVSGAAAEALGFISKDTKTSVCKQNHFIIKPLYQQRFLVCMLPPLLLVLKETDGQERVMLYYAFGNLVSGIPTSVVLTESKRVFPLVLESLSALSVDERQSGVLLCVLLILSAVLVDKNAAEFASHHVPAIIGRLLNLLNYGYSTMVRETSLLCLGALIGLPYARVFPFRTPVLKSLTRALDDPKRSVRKEAIRCRHVWESISR